MSTGEKLILNITQYIAGRTLRKPSVSGYSLDFGYTLVESSSANQFVKNSITNLTYLLF
jgi:hypothetical protein